MIDFLFNIISYVDLYVNSFLLYSIFLYLIFSVIFFTLALPGGLIIQLGSGFFFGFLIGFIINLVSISIGSMIFIYFSKTLFKKKFDKIFSKYSEKLSFYLNNSSYEYLILFRLIIGPPLLFQNTIISALNIDFKKIFISTVIGFAPIMMFVSYTGSYASNLIDLKNLTLSNIITFDVLLILALFIFLIVIKIYFKK